ncbi:hypothetical protein [Mucilaginibacter flavus]|uniref:hypothetical protein n=1 Tax=Mucilaginibacter flavus TaxID=931504 RepID=UPI0025B3EAE7|nr:hypothetical protein [Mucilaginibacter flavus]MDN3583774.1 hypothetical protein [Mucilaginibacter flavus]
MKKVFLVFLALVVLFIKDVRAQEIPMYGPDLNQKSLRINMGSQGVGAEFGYGINAKTALRLGANFIPLSANNAVNVSGFNSTSRVSASFSNVHLLADFTPFANAHGFRLVGGAAYFMNANGNLQMQPKSDYSYGDIVVPAADAGNLNMRVNWKGVAPYLGFGLLKAFPNHAFNINFDLGSYYLRRPDANIVGTGLLAGNSSQSAQLQRNLKDYRFLPVLQLNFNFKL